MSPAASKRCAGCAKEESPHDEAHKKCGRCGRLWYCSRDCQVDDWPTHKRDCRKPGTADFPMPHMAAYFKRIGSKDATFERLIDCFRLRVEDDYAWGQHNHGIYGGGDPLPVFQDFLTKAKAADMLPTWWDAEQERSCIQKAQTQTKENWADIHCAVEKHDIQEHYGDNMMPMSLRMCAERIYGGGYGAGQHPMPRGHQCFC